MPSRRRRKWQDHLSRFADDSHLMLVLAQNPPHDRLSLSRGQSSEVVAGVERWMWTFNRCFDLGWRAFGYDERWPLFSAAVKLCTKLSSNLSRVAPLWKTSSRPFTTPEASIAIVTKWPLETLRE